jgi:hypothetical protein
MTTPTPHGATTRIIEPPDFGPLPNIALCMPKEELWSYGCLVGYRHKLSEHDRAQSAQAASQHGAMPELLPCPFCSKKVPDDLSDTLYPSGIYWREDPDSGRHYISHSDEMSRAEDDNKCWEMNCTQNMGGCGSSISADSRDEVIAAWNRRAAIQQAAEPDLTAAYMAGHAEGVEQGIARAGAVPEGWKLVPIEPTREMWVAVNKLDDEMAAGGYDGKGCSIEQAWNCLLESAPTPPASGGSSDHLAACERDRVQVPLTDEAVRKAVARTGLFFTAPDMQIARAIEAAHGITAPALSNDAPTSQMKELSSNGGQGREGV